ncbi:Uncharacterised protein [Enterobacter hormaechei]|nr:Uncharacterised protein [Enterobacter hormaechei]
MTSDAPASAALITSSPLRVLTVSATDAVFTTTSWVWVLLLPALSVIVALRVTVPSVRAEMSLAGTPTLHLPLASTVVVYWFEPIVMTSLSPTLAPVAVPLTICACPCSTLLMTSSPATTLKLTLGGVVSSVIAFPALPGLPAASLTLTCTV